MAIHKTRDLCEAAYFWTLSDVDFVGLEPLGVDGKHREILYFKFEHSFEETELREKLSSYTNDQASVEPQMFFRKTCKLRDKIYANRNR